MAELVLKVGTKGVDPQYQDGDVMLAFNDRRVKHVHAESICHPKKIGFNADGLRDIDTLPDIFLKNVKQYKMQRISKYEVKRILLSDMSEEIISNKPNAKGEHMDVPLFIARRKAHKRHAIFGALGSEYWYGGKTDANASKLSTIWTAIEAQTSLLESDHTKYPLTSIELAHNLALSFDDFTDAESGDLTSPIYDNTDEENPILLKKRSRMVNWQSIGDLSEAVKIIVSDRTKSLDVRDSFSLLRSSFVTIKS